MQEIDKMDLYITGTCMKNRLPKELRIEKRSQTFKDMNRGDFISHTYEYVTSDGNIAKKYVLVLWKDRDIVYALTNCVNTREMGS